MSKELSQKQIEANRRNALKSTGPRTPAGKARSKLNAITHGIFANDIISSADGTGENARRFRKLLRDLARDYQPVGAMERLLVERIAVCTWRLARANRAENQAITNTAINNRPNGGLRITELRVVRSRTNEQAAAIHSGEFVEMDREELIKHASGLKMELESAREYIAESERHSPVKHTSATLPAKDQLDKIMRYEAALLRQLSTATDQLDRLQRRRQAEHVSLMEWIEEDEGGEEVPTHRSSSECPVEPKPIPSPVATGEGEGEGKFVSQSAHQSPEEIPGIPSPRPSNTGILPVILSPSPVTHPISSPRNAGEGEGEGHSPSSACHPMNSDYALPAESTKNQVLQNEAIPSTHDSRSNPAKKKCVILVRFSAKTRRLMRKKAANLRI